jgi:hypothetical protein
MSFPRRRTSIVRHVAPRHGSRLCGAFQPHGTRGNDRPANFWQYSRPLSALVCGRHGPEGAPTGADGRDVQLERF